MNRAEGISHGPPVPGVLFEGLAGEEDMERVRAVEERFPTIASALLKSAASYTARDECLCPRALERYRLRGDIGSDWRRWWD